MPHPLVMVRQYDGSPLRRVAVCVGNGRIYVSSERAIEAAESGALPPVGFPNEDVFAFEARTFDQMVEDWKTGRPVTWDQLQPYRVADSLPASRG